MQASGHHQSANINVKNFLSMIGISVFTLIRTDTTLDLSQKAEKVCAGHVRLSGTGGKETTYDGSKSAPSGNRTRG